MISFAIELNEEKQYKVMKSHSKNMTVMICMVDKGKLVGSGKYEVEV